MNDRKNIGQVITDATCTGCSACMNICPTLAISMKPDPEGFIMPMVDANLCLSCGKCVDICPVLNLKESTSSQPEVYAFRADDEIRAKSSSGGLFGVLSDMILAAGGHVSGVALDEEFTARNLLASTPEQVAQMRDSKYVQSDPGFIYKKIKIMLDMGEKILFSGTPCQVAGLKHYLITDYPNLITLDLVCHGVPSPKIFTRYLQEVAKGKNIKSISFRDKKHGWNSTFLDITFADGATYVGKNGQDAYESAFHSYLSLRKCCANCPFWNSPRQGDISSGDFWGYGKIEPQYSDTQGTNLLLVNNPKGSQMVEEIRQTNLFLRKVDLPPEDLKSRLQPKAAPSSQRERFFALQEQKTLLQAVNYVRDRYYDIGIVGNYLSENFGSVMTYYALYHVIQDLGYSALMIDRPMSAPVKPVSAAKLLEPDSYPPYVISTVTTDKWHMRDFNKHCGMFVVGSDQLFNASVYKSFDGFMSLEWVDNNKKKLAYAASCGHNDVWCSDALRSEISYFLKQFDAISVREKSAVEVFSRVYDVSAVHVADPVFLCARSHWDYLASLSPVNTQEQGAYIAGYILDPDKGKQDIVETVSAEKKLPFRIYTEFGRKKDFHIPIHHARVNTQLKELMDCRYFITDSFHGVCFSIIFKKDFVVIANKQRGYTRFQSILQDAGLMHRMIHTWDEFQSKKDALLQPIDYDQVYARLQPIKDMSLQWLQNQLQKKIRKPLQGYDLNTRMIAELRRQLNSNINSRVSQLEKQLDSIRQAYQADIAAIMAHMINPYNSVDELGSYLKRLNGQKDNLLILIAARDTPANTLSPEIQKAMQDLGLATNLHLQVRKSYLALINSGKVAIEQISDKNEPVSATQEVDGYQIELTSASHDFGDVAKIMVNSKDHSINHRGLNFVVLDKKSKYILDCVCFDTWLPHAPAYRKQASAR